MPDYLPSILNIIQTLAIVITLLVVAWQTKQLGKQIKFNTITSTSLHLRGVNELLLQDEKVAKLLEESREDALAAIIFGTFELWFQLHQEHMTDRLWWQADEATIIDTLKSEFMPCYWARNKHQYYRPFAEYIDGLLLKSGLEKQTLLETPQQKRDD